MPDLAWDRPAVLAGLVVAVHLGLAVSSTTPGMHTGGDNAAYLALANSLAHDGAYLEAWHPGSPPHTKYPPLYPGVLALLILLGAKSWGAFKAVSMVFTGLATAFCFLWVKRIKGPRLAAVATLLFGIAPGVLYAAQWILSDPLFLACTFAALWLLTPRSGSTAPPSARDLALGLALAVAAYFSRSAGLPLVVAAAVWLAIERRWKCLGGFAALFAALALPWQMRSGGDYASEFWMINPYAPDLGTAGPADMVRRVFANLSDYGLDHVPADLTGMSGTLAAVVGVVLSAAVLVGWGRRVRRGPGVAEIFFVLYAGLVLVWPDVWSGGRFGLPLFPLMLLYAGETAALVAGRVFSKPVWTVGALVAFLFVLPAGVSWFGKVGPANQCRARVITLGPVGCYPSRVREFHAMALWAREGLPEGAIVFSRKPRIFYAFSGHPSITYPFTDDGNSLLVQADSIGVDYLVLGNWDTTGPAYVHPVVSAHPERFCAVARLEPPGEAPIFLLQIIPPRPDDADDATEPSGTNVALATCLRDGPAPSAADLASMRVPILDRSQ